jgi:hypothetical protein
MGTQEREEISATMLQDIVTLDAQQADILGNSYN